MAIDILSNNAGSVDFEIVNRRVRSLSDPRARRGLLRVFANAPKWETAACLLEAMTDADEEVRALASILVDRWIEHFNRAQTQPTANQRQRIRAFLDAAAPQLSAHAANMLRISLPEEKLGEQRASGDPAR
jgi:hypothetical protein